ncbi:hypothetical protein GCM10007205_11360 [Oxalicibacterium flavum]|uniref:AbiTii domain-containing protein n=1 Tax=Oxalicibacterium flavum TaxID=179467 RepID=A0A8J2UKF7_9BURK|nr:hypothetical protein [Oxalicibacterium flavum]GGC03927.1 hypothetical protein GCM10007205_11360 [Oxalicibacterium flavum]
MSSLILQIQSEAMDGSSSVASLLRKVRAAAVKLDLADELQWITLELNGYDDVAEEDLPSYRKLVGEMKVKNPYHGLQTLQFADAKLAEIVTAAPCRQSVAELEALLASGSGSLHVQLSQEHINLLLQLMSVKMEPILKIERTAVIRVLDAVRNLVLNWSLEMEKVGVLGESMTFNTQEKIKAQPAGQQFFIQNVGVLGNVSDHAIVSNTQHASMALDLDQVRDVVAQLNNLISSLPNATNQSLTPILAELNAELVKSAPTTSRIKTLLQSAKSICEGATGNIIASGAIALLTPLIGP